LPQIALIVTIVERFSRRLHDPCDEKASKVGGTLRKYANNYVKQGHNSSRDHMRRLKIGSGPFILLSVATVRSFDGD